GAGEEGADGLLHLLGADAQEAQRPAPAARAEVGRAAPGPAVVAAQLLGGGVVGEGDAASRAGDGVAAGAARQEAGEAAAIQEEERLLPAVQPVLDGTAPGGRGE